MKVFLSLCIFVATAVAHPTSCPPCSCECPPTPPPLPPCSCEFPPPPCSGEFPPPPCSGEFPPPPCSGEIPLPSCEDSCNEFSITSSSSTTVTVVSEATFITNKELYPKCVPKNWNILEFNSVYETQAFQGNWILTMCSPIVCIDGLTPSHYGIFSNGFPCSNPRIYFEDTTPDCDSDYNANFYMTDVSFNLITQRIEKTKGLLKSAYPGSNLAIFDVCTESYYPSLIKEIDEICDDNLVRIPCDDVYKRDYLLACVGADKEMKEYMVFVIINKYNSLFCGKDKYFILVVTRDVNPCTSVYEKAFNDIKACGLNPYYLISIDQSIDLSKIPGCLEDIESLIESSPTVVKSIDTTTITSSGGSSSITSTSTDYFVLKPSYKPDFDVDVYEYCGKYKILKGLPIEALQDILNAKWYVQSGSPCLLEDVDQPKFGLLHNTFPCRSLQINFDTSIPWAYKSPLMMSERAYNALTGEITTTRSIITSAFGDDCPYPVFVVSTEGCYNKVIPKCVTITPDGCIIESPGSIYIDYYFMYIVGYKKDEFTIFYIPPTYKNLFCENDDEGLVYVLTRSRIVNGNIIEEINQQLLLCGFSPSHLINIDQYLEIEEECLFNSEFFEYQYSSSSSSSSITVEKSCSTSVTTSCGC